MREILFYIILIIFLIFVCARHLNETFFEGTIDPWRKKNVVIPRAKKYLLFPKYKNPRRRLQHIDGRFYNVSPNLVY